MIEDDSTCPNDLGPCAEHPGYRMPNGYGQVRREGKTWLAHRWAAYVAHGPCPSGQVVRHRCDNRGCINPDHLEYGTQGDNLLDRTRRHRYHKLTFQDARDIAAALDAGATLRELAERYGVSIAMIHHIKSGKQWSEATNVRHTRPGDQHRGAPQTEGQPVPGE